MPLIMLDGVDGAGKTTYAKELCAAWDGPSRLIHRSRFEGNPMDEYENSLMDYMPNNGELVVLDRWFLSELVYGTVLRGTSKLHIRDTVHVERFLASRGALNIIMTASTEVILSRLRKRGEDYLPFDKVTQVNKLFISWAKENDWITLRSPTAVTVHETLKAAVAIEQTIALVGAPVSYVGPPQPSHLLVMSDHEVQLAGQPVWHEPTGTLTPTVSVRSKKVGQVLHSQMNHDLWYRLGCPPVLADLPSTADKLFTQGFEFVDVY